MALQGNTFWIAYRIESDGEFARRFERLARVIEDSAEGRVWGEPASFYLFRSKCTLDELTNRVGAVLRVDRDFAVVGMSFRQNARLIGSWRDDRLRELLTYAEVA